jgi:hypothetical protein
MKLLVAHAESGIDSAIHTLNEKIFNPVIELAFIIALVAFLYGVVVFIRNSDNKDAREKGRWHIMAGSIGLLIMFTVYGIINLLINTFGIKGPTINKDQQRFEAPIIQDVKIGG